MSRIFYAVQATGNGHISRAMELLPYLQAHGEVDVFLSGSNSHLPAQLPVRYRSRGLSLHYNQSGGLSYTRLIRELRPLGMIREAMQLPVENYDVVINDFESITALACLLKKKHSVNFGHQASFQSKLTPRPAIKDRMGELILKNYARATSYMGLHFQPYDDFIYSPVIKEEILRANPTNQQHITVYLPSCSDQYLLPLLKQVPQIRFEVFLKEAREMRREANLQIFPISKENFNQSLIHCEGIITGAGFETPAEALYLGKKLMVSPIKGQYEQACNAAALELLGIPVIKHIGQHLPRQIEQWMNEKAAPAWKPIHTTREIITRLFDTYPFASGAFPQPA